MASKSCPLIFNGKLGLHAFNNINGLVENLQFGVVSGSGAFTKNTSFPDIRTSLTRLVINYCFIISWSVNINY